MLTLVRDGAVVDTAGRTLVTQAALREAALTLRIAPDVGDVRVSSDTVDVAWLTPSRAAVLHHVVFRAGDRRLEELQVVVFEGGRRVDSTVPVGLPGVRLDASRDGTLVAVRPGMLLGDDARTIYPVPGAGTGRATHAVAVSPDGRFVALALRGRVSLMSVAALRAGRFRSVSLPFEARDLAWR